MPRDQYFVYIMTNTSRTLYTGVTNDLVRRVYEHKNKIIPGFPSRYNISQLVYFEETSDVQTALQEQHITSSRVLTTPTPLNNWLWFIAAETQSGYYVGHRSVFDKGDSIDFIFFLLLLISTSYFFFMVISLI